MKDLAGIMDFAGLQNKKNQRPSSQSIRTKRSDMCYTSFALTTSVVLCGPSGALLNLRLPAFSFLRKFYA